jgi:hypothetical protein
MDSGRVGHGAVCAVHTSSVCTTCTQGPLQRVNCPSIPLRRKTWGFPSQYINQPRGYGHTTRATVMATLQERRLWPKGLWPHYKSDAWGITPERVSNQEPPDSRPCVQTTTLLGGYQAVRESRLSPRHTATQGLLRAVPEWQCGGLRVIPEWQCGGLRAIPEWQCGGLRVIPEWQCGGLRVIPDQRHLL